MLPNPGLTRSFTHLRIDADTGCLCLLSLCLTPSCLSQMASNAGGVVCPVASTGCALLSFPISHTAPSCFKVPPVCVPWCVLCCPHSFVLCQVSRNGHACCKCACAVY